MVDDKKHHKGGHLHKAPALSEADLTQVVGGVCSIISGKKIITGSHSCQWFQIKESLEQQKEGSRFCSYCRHKDWEGTNMVCSHPYNNTNLKKEEQ